MKIRFWFLSSLGLFVLSAAIFGASPQQHPNSEVLSAPEVKKDLYPGNVDASKEIDLAIKKAAKVHKKILLIFGGNWCYDCHVLDRALHEGAAGEIVKTSYLIVHVDIGEGEKNQDLMAKYQVPIEKGVPAVAILKADGSMIYSSGNGEFESARSMIKKDLVAFLQHWRN
jgi:thiol:disulfide interchange protein